MWTCSVVAQQLMDVAAIGSVVFMAIRENSTARIDVVTRSGAVLTTLYPTTEDLVRTTVTRPHPTLPM